MNRILTTVTLTIACVLLLAACADSSDAPEPKVVEVEKEVIVEKEIIKEVPVEVVVEKEVVREVQVPGETVVVTQEVIKEVQVPGETVVVTKEVPVEVVVETVVEKEVIREVQVNAPPLATAAPAQAGGPQGPAGTSGARRRSPASTPAPAGPPSATTFQDYQRSRFVSAAEDSVSTFSLDTDRTSYHLALNWARSGYEVEPDSVRAEEWINAFNYRYDPAAAAGQLRHHHRRLHASPGQPQAPGAHRLPGPRDAGRHAPQRDAGAGRLRLYEQRRPGQHRAGGRREHQAKPGRGGTA